MKNKEIKKIQFGGWNKRPFSEIRKKIEVMMLEDELPERHRRRRRSKKCKFNKGVHIYEKQKEHDFLRRIYCNYICKNCGKQKFEVKSSLT